MKQPSLHVPEVPSWTLMDAPDPLGADAYKYSMGQAGYPLRLETFTFCFRRGGWHYIPFDLEEKVRRLVPRRPDRGEYNYLAEHNYRMTEGMLQALSPDGDWSQSALGLDVRAIPEGLWFGDREPILTVTGPSFLVSWLETQLIWLNYQIQLATSLKFARRTETEQVVPIVCEEQRALVEEVFEAVGITRPIKMVESYPKTVRDRLATVVDVLGGEGDVGLRFIEGGMRSAVCMEHHRMVLEACKEVGIVRTSNLALARELALIPSGTAGHEHSKRCGDDLTAIINYMDRVCGLVSCLPDTFSTMRFGLPATVSVASANPHRNFLFRLDSGDRLYYFHAAAATFREHGLENVLINVAGDQNAKRIAPLENLRRLISWEPNRLSYMIGGQYTAETLPSPLTRSRVAAVYKLSMTGKRPVMKYSDDPGKRSVPGHPVTWRRLRGDGPVGIIGQLGETPPDDYAVLNGNPEVVGQLNLLRAFPTYTPNYWKWGPNPIPHTLSPESKRLVTECERRDLNFHP